VSQVGGLDLDLGEIDILLRDCGSGKQQSGARKRGVRNMSHASSPLCGDEARDSEKREWLPPTGTSEAGFRS
jgi:hypothetical protein